MAVTDFMCDWGGESKDTVNVNIFVFLDLYAAPQLFMPQLVLARSLDSLMAGQGLVSQQVSGDAWGHIKSQDTAASLPSQVPSSASAVAMEQLRSQLAEQMHLSEQLASKLKLLTTDPDDVCLALTLCVFLLVPIGCQTVGSVQREVDCSKLSVSCQHRGL